MFVVTQQVAIGRSYILSVASITFRMRESTTLHPFGPSFSRLEELYSNMSCSIYCCNAEILML